MYVCPVQTYEMGLLCYLNGFIDILAFVRLSSRDLRGRPGSYEPQVNTNVIYIMIWYGFDTCFVCFVLRRGGRGKKAMNDDDDRRYVIVNRRRVKYRFKKIEKNTLSK